MEKLSKSAFKIVNVLALICLCLAPTISQSETPSLTYDQKLKIVEEAQKNLCGSGSSSTDATPAVPASSKLEATICLDCAKPAASLEGTEKKVDDTVSTSNDAAKKAQTKSDLNFFKYFENSGSYYGSYYGSYGTGTPEYYKAKIENLNSTKNSYASYLKTTTEAVAKIKPVVDAVEAIKKGATSITAEQKGPLSEIIQKRIDYFKESITSYKTQGEYYQKVVDSTSTSYSESDKEYYKKYAASYLQKAAEFEQTASDLASLIEQIKTDSIKPLPEKVNAALASVVSDANYQQQNIKSYESNIKSIESQVKEFEAKLKEIEAAPKPTEPADEDEKKLKEYEKKFSSSSLSISTNKGYKPCNLTLAEILAIMHYTSYGYADMNRALRKGPPDSDKYAAFTETLTNGLKKLGSYKGLVLRGANLPSEVLEQHKVGEVVTYQAFTSASLTDGFGFAHRFAIQSKNGHYVGSYSTHYSENEVIFVPGTKFKILSREEKGSSVEFVMEEVE